MASSSDNQPSQPSSDESLNELQINGLIDYFDKIKASLSDNGHVPGAILKPNPPKHPLPAPVHDSAAFVPFCVGLCVSGMANPNIDSRGPNKSSHDTYGRDRLFAQAEKLQRELLDVRRELGNFRKLNDDVASTYRDFASGRIDLQTVPDEAQLEGRFRLVTDMVQSLKHRVKAAEEPFALTFEPYYLVLDKNQGTDMWTRVKNTSCYRDHLYNNLRGMFDQLDETSRECLMCFSVFPENAVLRKSFLKNWWIGEGLFKNDEDGRKMIDKFLNLFLEKGFIEPFLKKRRLAGFKVDPLTRFFLINIAEERGFSRFDPMGWPSDEISPRQRAFLVKHGEDYSRIALAKDVPSQDPGKLKTLFNVNDSYPDFKEDWFSKLRNLEVLSLGGLHGLLEQDIRAGDENMNNRKFKGPRVKQGLLRQHIEVEDTQFLKGMKNMKKLKFLGLQGISRLMKIPESIGNLSGLVILDLCACHNLESLPKALEKIRSLTHLDVSECYLLDHIPKGIKNLSKLEVLKGFLVRSSTSEESCTLGDLKSLTRLRKISIYTNNRNFPDNKDLEVLKGFKALQNLAIVWGGKSVEILDKAAQIDLSSADDSNPLTDSAPASVPPCKDDNVMETIPEGDEIESTKQCLAPMTAPIRSEAMKKKSKSLKRVLSGKNQEGSVRMRNVDNNTNPSDIPDVAASMQEGLTNENETLQSVDTPGIRKLELQCYPGTEVPAWVVEGKLKPQKKLYIGGGNLRSLGRGDPKWTISILRLKFLRDLEMDWTGLKKSFPKLIYLEKVRCPKLSFVPCDNTGVWWKRDIKEEELVALGLGLPWNFLKRKAC